MAILLLLYLLQLLTEYITEYMGLAGDNILTLVNTAIGDLDLATGIDYENDTYDEIVSKAEAKETIFKVRINTLKNTLKQMRTKENKVKSLQK